VVEAKVKEEAGSERGLKRLVDMQERLAAVPGNTRGERGAVGCDMAERPLGGSHATLVLV
jgi:hypothetical protein